MAGRCKPIVTASVLLVTFIARICSGVLQVAHPIDSNEALNSVSFVPSKLSLEIGKSSNTTISLGRGINVTTKFFFNYDNDGIVVDIPDVSFSSEDISESIRVTGAKAGSVVIGINTSTAAEFSSLAHVFLRVSVFHSSPLNIFGQVIGWIYFLAWSISFYPQIIVNYRRKSVVGLNFDFLALNITGFTCYSIFNVGLFWIPEIQKEYYAKFPRGLIPVEIPDVVFALHAVLLTAVCIAQTFIYERADQRLSIVCRAILSIFAIFAFISVFVAIAGKITWLMYLNFLSYVKLAITLIKYIPQAFMNFRRKSTEGWSIGNILLDFTGGSLSIAQMFINSYNYHDWTSIFGNPTKFGLGMFSVLFDMLFMFQHYVLYRTGSHRAGYDVINESNPHQSLS